MPKKLSDLKKLKQGERQKAVIDAVKKIGMATIAEVTVAVSERFEIDLKTQNVQEALKKSIRLDLSEMAGTTLGVAYFSRDPESPERLNEDDLEYDQNRKVKNIYNKKYFLLSSDSAVSGGDLITKINGLFIAQPTVSGKPSVNWSISSFLEVRKSHVHIVFKSTYGDFICIAAPTDELPFKLIISRIGSKGHIPSVDFLRSELGFRSAFISWPDQGISSFKKSSLGHVLVDFKSSGKNADIYDLGSTNGTKVTVLSDEYLERHLRMARWQGTAPKEQDAENRAWQAVAVKKESNDETKQMAKGGVSVEAGTVSQMAIPFSMKVGGTEVMVFIK